MAEMRLGAVLDLLDLAEELGVDFWINCGWAVDATLGRQTRGHRDLDILIERRHETTFAEALRKRGFEPVHDDDERPWSYVLADTQGREVDFHVIEWLPTGGWAHGPEGGPAEELIPAAALDGEGQIGDRRVRCPTPETLVRWHTGYSVGDRDWADVSALCSRFDIAVPDDYATFRHRT
jgi:lincosamide nucleotidyltransferase A/C/D/E